MKNHDPKGPGNAEGPGQPEPSGEFKPAEYLRAVKAHLRNGRQKAAYTVLLEAVVLYPREPLLLSYYGCLQALVDKKYQRGVDNCKKAINLFQGKESFGVGALYYPVFYLNLGRAYLAGGKKKNAFDAFTKGLKYESSHPEIKRELRGLGIRKKPPVPFLDRSNPINKYVGMILHKPSK
jgi:tetratricopeptide (TPR) repeat protein